MQMTTSIKSGTLDAVVTAVSLISPAVPQIDVFSLPFLYKDTTEVLAIANGPFGARMTPKVNEAFDCENLGYTTDGSTEMWFHKHPVTTPADMAGLKMGVGPSKIQRDTMEAFGAIPTVVDITAIYTALQTRLIDGTPKTRPDVLELKIYQVAKYLTLANLFTTPNLLLVSKKFLDRLSAQDREVVRQAGKVAADAQKDAVLASEKTALAFMQQHGVQVAAVENIAAFRDKVSGVYKGAADRIGSDLIAEARKLAST